MHTMTIRNAFVGIAVVVFLAPSCGGGGNGSVSKADALDTDVADVVDVIDTTVIVPDPGVELPAPPDTPEVQPDGSEGECTIDGDCVAFLGPLGVCEWAQCVDKSCEAIPLDVGTPCDDDDQCTLDTTCTEGVCEGGEPVDCEDGNPCTLNECQPLTGCAMSPLTGVPCDDENDCTSGDGCLVGQCIGGPNSCGEDCSNGVDDNEDGAIDCNDAVCIMDPVCTHICVPSTTIQCDDLLTIDITGNESTKYTTNWPCTTDELAGYEHAVLFNHVSHVTVTATLVNPTAGAQILHLNDTQGFGCQADQCLEAHASELSFAFKPGDEHYVVVDTPTGTEGSIDLQVNCAPCTPQCDGKSCGSDGCGGKCGTCLENMVCSTKGTCVEPAPNDTCSDAVVIDPSTLPFIDVQSTVGSTDDYSLPVDSGCPGSLTLAKGKYSSDTAYIFQPTATGSYLIATNSSFNAVAYVITDCTNEAGTCVGVSTTTTPGSKQLVAELDKGTLYYIVVDGHAGKVAGTYTLTVASWPCSSSCSGKQCGPNGCGGTCGSCVPTLYCNALGECVDQPVNDACDAPKAITELAVWLDETTLGAVDDYFVYPEVCPGGPAINTVGDGAPDVVYQFQPPANGKYRVTVEPSFNAVLSVRDACPGLLQDCIGGSDTSGVESVTFVRSQGESVWVFVDGSNAGDSGNFTMKVEQLSCVPVCDGKECGPDSCGGQCGQCPVNALCTENGACADIPTNDTCEGAFAIAQLPFTTWGSTEAASNDYEVLPNTCPGGPAAATYGYGNDVVYAYTASQPESVVFNLDSNDTTFNSFLYAVSDCSDIVGSCMMAQDAAGTGGESLVLDLGAGQTVYVIVDGSFVSSSGAYFLSATIK